MNIVDIMMEIYYNEVCPAIIPNFNRNRMNLEKLEDKIEYNILIMQYENIKSELQNNLICEKKGDITRYTYTKKNKYPIIVKDTVTDASKDNIIYILSHIMQNCSIDIINNAINKEIKNDF